MPSAPKKTAQVILDSGNDYLGALKGNQSGLLTAVEANFQAQQTVQQINKGHGRIEKRTVSISHQLEGIPKFPGLQTLIRVQSERQVHRASIIEVSTETRYYIASFIDSALAFADRIRGYWGVENKAKPPRSSRRSPPGGSAVHYVRDVTQGEDASRIRTPPLVQIWALARNFALNLYRDNGFQNMAQAQRRAGFSLNTLKDLFRMK
jgi:predicted transposase YbfD/YdcC